MPGPDRRVSVEDVRAKGLEAIFAPDLEPPLRLVVDLGFGRGEFVRQLAAEAPETAHLGVELSKKRVFKLARRLARTEGEGGNLRLIEATAEEVTREALPDASVDTFWINCPDPWPKRRHHPRRMIQPAFAALLARRLRPGGVLEVATDHAAYARWIDQVLRAEPSLANRWDEPFLHEVPGRIQTGYERDWRAMGRSLHFFRYARVPVDATDVRTAPAGDAVGTAPASR